MGRDQWYQICPLIINRNNNNNRELKKLVYETGKKLLKLALLLALVALSISYFQKDDLPDKSAVLRELYQEPVQIETSAEPFTIEREGAVYTITPLYEYELYGLVTSQ